MHEASKYNACFLYLLTALFRFPADKARKLNYYRRERIVAAQSHKHTIAVIVGAESATTRLLPNRNNVVDAVE